MAIDWTLFKLCNGLAGRWPILDTVIRVLINDYALTTALVLLLFALWFSGKSATVREQNQRAVLSAIASMLLGNVFVKALNLLFYRPRPFADHTVTLLFYRPSDSSFPSNPAAVVFAIATAVWLSHRKMGWLLYFLAVLMCFARVYVGVHYPLDIIGGAAVAVFTVYFTVRIVFPLCQPMIALILWATKKLCIT